MQDKDDSAMLTALKDGNIKAYQYFFMKYYKPLCLKARTMLNSMEEAEQLVQHIFVEVWEDRLYHEIEHSVGGYFYKKVHNSCVNLVRKNDADKGLSTDQGFLLMQGILQPPTEFHATDHPQMAGAMVLSYKDNFRQVFRIFEESVAEMRSFLTVALKALWIHIKL